MWFTIYHAKRSLYEAIITIIIKIGVINITKNESSKGVNSGKYTRT